MAEAPDASAQVAGQSNAAASQASASPDSERLPHKGGPIPSGYHLESTPEYTTMAVGGVIAGIGVVWFSVLAVSENRESLPDSCWGCPETSSPGKPLAMLGALMLTGFGLVTTIVGLVTREDTLVKDLKNTAAVGSPHPVRWYAGPQGSSQIGLGVMGTF